MVPEDRIAGVHNYFLGRDPHRWRTDVPRFARVRTCHVWPGVDVVCYEKDGHLEYDVEVAPGADLSEVSIAVEGGENLRIDAGGAMIFDTAIGVMRQPPPATYALDATGGRRKVAAEYVLRGADRFGFAAPDWRRGETLIVDPALLWSTFIGGAGEDVIVGVASVVPGVVNVAGRTRSASYPTTVGAWQSTNSDLDAFVSQLNSNIAGAQQLVYSTFIGGSKGEGATGIAVDVLGIVTIAGGTDSPDFPLANPYDPTPNSSHDGFVARLDPRKTGSQQLVYSSFLGGSGKNYVEAVQADLVGVVTVCGYTTSGDFPTTSNALSRAMAGSGDAFVARLATSSPPTQQLTYSTFLGGNSGEDALDVATDAIGRIAVAGSTTSSDFPTSPGAWSRSQVNGDAYVALLDPLLPRNQQLVYSTLVGGSSRDLASAVAVDDGGILTIAGFTTSSDFPRSPGSWNTPGRSFDVFVSRLDPSKPTTQQLIYSTDWGGTNFDVANAVHVDRSGIITIVGQTQSIDYPTTRGAWRETHSGSSGVNTDAEAAITRIDPSRTGVSQLLYSTYMGGTHNDYGLALHVDNLGVVTMAGQSSSTDYPTTVGALDRTYNGDRDGIITKLDLLPTGARRIGRSSPGCDGPIPISVTSMPQIGNTRFALTCQNAPPNSNGLIGFAEFGLAAPVPILGVELWLDPFRSFGAVTYGSSSDKRGVSDFRLPVPNDTKWIGGKFVAQFFWFGPTAPGPCPKSGYSASDALEIEIQR